MSYAIEWKHKGIVTAWSGSTGSGEVIRFLKEIQADSRFDDLLFSIHDYRNCDEIRFDPSSMEEVAALDRAGSASNPRIRVAIVADRPKVLEMVSAYVTAELSPYMLRVFHDMPEALTWLGIADTAQTVSLS